MLEVIYTNCHCTKSLQIKVAMTPINWARRTTVVSLKYAPPPNLLHTNLRQKWGGGICPNIQFALWICPLTPLHSLQSWIHTVNNNCCGFLENGTSLNVHYRKSTMHEAKPKARMPRRHLICGIYMWETYLCKNLGLKRREGICLKGTYLGTYGMNTETLFEVNYNVLR